MNHSRKIMKMAHFGCIIELIINNTRIPNNQTVFLFNLEVCFFMLDGSFLICTLLSSCKLHNSLRILLHRRIDGIQRMLHWRTNGRAMLNRRLDGWFALLNKEGVNEFQYQKNTKQLGHILGPSTNTPLISSLVTVDPCLLPPPYRSIYNLSPL